MSLPVGVSGIEALDLLSRFRVEFYACLYKRADALFELTDAVLCADGPVKTLVELSLAVEHRRGHGALYAALDRGWLEPTRLRRTLAGLPLPRRNRPDQAPDGLPARKTNNGPGTTTSARPSNASNRSRNTKPSKVKRQASGQAAPLTEGAARRLSRCVQLPVQAPSWAFTTV